METIVIVSPLVALAAYQLGFKLGDILFAPTAKKEAQYE